MNATEGHFSLLRRHSASLVNEGDVGFCFFVRTCIFLCVPFSADSRTDETMMPRPRGYHPTARIAQLVPDACLLSPATHFDMARSPRTRWDARASVCKCLRQLFLASPLYKLPSHLELPNAVISSGLGYQDHYLRCKTEANQQDRMPDYVFESGSSVPSGAAST